MRPARPRKRQEGWKQCATRKEAGSQPVVLESRKERACRTRNARKSAEAKAEEERIDASVKRGRGEAAPAAEPAAPLASQRRGRASRQQTWRLGAALSPSANGKIEHKTRAPRIDSRRSGKLTLNQALAGGEGGRQRSLRRYEAQAGTPAHRRAGRFYRARKRSCPRCSFPRRSLVSELANRISERVADVVSR